MMKTLNKIIFLLTMLITFSAGTAFAEDKFYVDETAIEPGTTASINFILDNKTLFYGFQAVVELPEGLSFVKKSDGKVDMSLDASRTAGGEYLLVTKENGRFLNVAAFSTANPQVAIVGNEGTLATIKVEATKDFSGGKVKLTRIKFIKENDVDDNLNDSSTDIGVLPISVTIDNTPILLETTGLTQTFTATITPDFATDKTLTWESKDPHIATVDENGNVTGLSRGSATIVVKTVNGKEGIGYVVVGQHATSIELSDYTKEIPIGSTYNLEAIVGPPDAENKLVVWNSSDENVATVDKNGTIIAQYFGKATITATALGGIDVSASCEVTVVPILPESVTLDKTSVDLRKDDTFTLSATIHPENATDTTITWTSSDESVATVSDEGVVTAVNKGSAIITAATHNGKTATCDVTVTIPVTGIKLQQSASLYVGKTISLVAEISPEDASDKTVTWSSSNEEIATVDKDGLVTAIAVGEAIITVTANDGSDVKATCAITVNPIPVSSISLNKESESLKVGETMQLEETVLPEDATNKTVTWTSSNVEIATVDANGKVTAVALGDATITVTANDGSKAEASCKISVIPTPVVSISLNETYLNLKEGEKFTLIPTILPEDATYKTVTWKTSDEEAAIVDQNGVVTALKQGLATITATSSDGVSASCAVTVYFIAVDNIELNEYSLEMKLSDKYQLTATITPEDAMDKSVTWKSSDENVAKVSDNGLVTAVAAGNATIIASSSNGKSAQCDITVVTISLSQPELLMREGKTAELMAIIHPDNASDRTVTWSSSDEYVATVNDKGIVTAIKLGTATISALTEPGISAECKVTVVVNAVDKIELDESFIEIPVNDIYKLTATISPEDATDRSITWRSADKSVATVSEDGVVTAVEVGNTIIYASSSNGLTATCQVDVISLSISQTELMISEGETAELFPIYRPGNALHQAVNWSSSNESVATVDAQGKVTGKSVGTAVITATSVEHPSLKAECKVTVEKVDVVIAVQDITITPELIMTEGDVYTLSATITPEDASDKSVTWKTSDKAIATVSEDGTVTAISEGEATIYASSSNGLTAECKVTVKKGDIPVTGISLTNTSLIIREGMSSELIPVITPTNATDQSITWTSDDDGIAKVDDKGIVTGVKQGLTNVTATSSNGLTAICEVTVIPLIIPVETITLNKTELELTEEESEILIATITPDDATDKTVTWKSLDTSKAIVSEDGRVTAVGVGTTTVMASSSNGLSAYCTVTVKQGLIPVTGITLTNSTLLIAERESTEITAIITPVNATDPSVTWTSSDESIAIVDAKNPDAIVTGVKQGVAIITATSSNGLKAYCEVTVIPNSIPVDKIILEPSEITLIQGDFRSLIPTIEPAEASDKSLTWTSSDETVAIVDSNGKVTAVNPGSAVITVMATNGVSADCKVTVLPLEVNVESISLDRTELDLTVDESTQLIATVTPENATSKSISWSSLDEITATVTEDGLVTAITPGTTSIVATSSNGLSATCKVTVTLSIFDDGNLIYHVIDDNSVEVIGRKNPNLTSIDVPSQASYISPTITLTFNVVAIAENAFKDCSNLQSIYLLDSIKKIGSDAFTGCEALTAVVIYSKTPPTIEGNPFPEKTTIYVPIPNDYKNAQSWKNIPNNIKELVTIDDPIEVPNLSQNATLQISTDIKIKDKPIYWTSSNEAIATVDDKGLVTMLYVGETIITVSCDGYSDSYKLIVYPMHGDSNWDGVINVADPVNIANYVVKKYDTLINWTPQPWGSPSSWNREYWDGFYDISSDINGQNGITVADASEVVSIILASSSSPSSLRKIVANQALDEEADALIISKRVTSKSNSLIIPVNLINSIDYVALQADIRVPEGMHIEEVLPGKSASNHKLSSRRIDEQSMRVVLFDLNNSTFAEDDGTILEIEVYGDSNLVQDIDFTNIVASDIYSNSYNLVIKDNSMIDGVDYLNNSEIEIKNLANGLYVGNAKGLNIMIYSLEGAIQKSFVACTDAETISLTKGIYIIIVGNKTAKVAVK